MFRNLSVCLPVLCNFCIDSGTSEACGPDGISARIVHKCLNELSAPLAKLCMMSPQQGIFPQEKPFSQFIRMPFMQNGSHIILWQMFEWFDSYVSDREQRAVMNR